MSIAAIHRFFVAGSAEGKGLFLAPRVTHSPQECFGILGKAALSLALIISAVLL